MTRPLTRGVAALRLPFALLARLLRGVLHRSALTGDAAAWPASLAFEGLSVPSASLAHAPSRPSGPIDPAAAEGQLSLCPEKSTGRKRRGARLAVALSYLVSLGAIVALAGGATYGFFSATNSSQSNSFGAGKVTLTTPATSTCTAVDLYPGETPAPCTLQVQYTGSVDAYVALDVLIATKAVSPGTLPLYNPADAGKDLQVAVSDDQSASVTYVSPATDFGAALVSCPAGSGYDASYTCYELTDLLANTVPFANGSDPITFSTTVSLPTDNPSGYQYGTASIVLTAHAVQSSNQTLGLCTAGSPCTSVVWG